jgi:hypothetical protein
MSIGILNTAPIPIKVMRINVAITVYGRFSAASTTDMCEGYCGAARRLGK